MQPWKLRDLLHLEARDVTVQRKQRRCEPAFLARRHIRGDLAALSPTRCLRQAADHREAFQLANVCQLPPRVRQAMRSTW